MKILILLLLAGYCLAIFQLHRPNAARHFHPPVKSNLAGLVSLYQQHWPELKAKLQADLTNQTLISQWTNQQLSLSPQTWLNLQTELVAQPKLCLLQLYLNWVKAVEGQPTRFQVTLHYLLVGSTRQIVVSQQAFQVTDGLIDWVQISDQVKPWSLKGEIPCS